MCSAAPTGPAQFQVQQPAHQTLNRKGSRTVLELGGKWKSDAVMDGPLQLGKKPLLFCPLVYTQYINHLTNGQGIV